MESPCRQVINPDYRHFLIRSWIHGFIINDILMFRISSILIICTFLFFLSCESSIKVDMFEGPLRASADNSRYFTDNHGKAIYLTGAHTWNNLVDMIDDDSVELFDYPGYLSWMKQNKYNFFRLWAWELMNWDTRGNRETDAQVLSVFPHPWARTGPGNALDGKLKFDLDRYDNSYFSRLEERVRMAADMGIYVSVMLFEGWGLQFSPNAFENHPFHPDNNINGINGDTDADGSGVDIHTLADERILSIQEAYVRKVIETVNEYDNVLYEIANECQPSSTDWQYHMINFVKEYEKQFPYQHPVGMTFQYKGGSNQVLFDSPADWISPNPEGGYRDDPPAGDGSKVVITDTDHLWGIGGNASWVWKSFIRGLNPIFMDPYDCRVLTGSFDPEWVEPLRSSLKYSAILADTIALNKMIPQSQLVSTDYCLADEGNTYIIYLPDTITVTVRPGETSGAFEYTWFDPLMGESSELKMIQRGEIISLTSPFATKGNILILMKKEE
jgi:hypothetical protein